MGEEWADQCKVEHAVGIKWGWDFRLLCYEVSSCFHGGLVSLADGNSHLGPFVLTTELLPLLKKSAEKSEDVRVVKV